jgi:hypothetical protein
MESGRNGTDPRTQVRAGKDHQGMRGNENLNGWFLPIIIIVFRADRVKDDGGTNGSFLSSPGPGAVRYVHQAGVRGLHP